MPHSQGRVLTRTYSLLAAASVVPLLVVIVILALFQFTTQRQQLLEELEGQAVEHNILLEQRHQDGAGPRPHARRLGRDLLARERSGALPPAAGGRSADRRWRRC